MLKRHIKRNAAQCLKCGEVIESRYRHDFVTCSCGALSVDGGRDYIRRVYEDESQYVDMDEYEEGE